MRARLASANEDKLRELRGLLPDWDLEALDMDGMPEETGASFYDNARAKARFGRMVSGLEDWIIGEDSGLEVDGLAGAPGIRSARYAGPQATDEENVAKLLAELAGAEGGARQAR